MAFTNHNIRLDELPRLNTLSMQSLSEKYRPINLLITATIIGILLAIVTIAHFQTMIAIPAHLHDYYPFGMLVIAIVGVLMMTHGYFSDGVKCYAVREHDISFSSGLFFRKIVSQPITRIQHVEIKRGPIERAANLATLQVFSAGGIMHTFEIPGLEHQVALDLRQFLLTHKDLQKND